MIKASKRSQGISYAIREVVLPARKLEEKGIKVLHLNIGDPNKYDFDTPQHMKDALLEATNQGYNGYSPSEGDVFFLLDTGEGTLSTPVSSQQGQAICPCANCFSQSSPLSN